MLDFIRDNILWFIGVPIALYILSKLGKLIRWVLFVTIGIALKVSSLFVFYYSIVTLIKCFPLSTDSIPYFIGFVFLIAGTILTWTLGTDAFQNRDNRNDGGGGGGGGGGRVSASSMDTSSRYSNSYSSPSPRPSNTPTRSTCRYCNAQAVGPGCPFSGIKGKHTAGDVHVHTPNGNKCVYCGSVAVGPGCPYSPSGIHSRV